MASGVASATCASAAFACGCEHAADTTIDGDEADDAKSIPVLLHLSLRAFSFPCELGERKLASVYQMANSAMSEISAISCPGSTSRGS